MAEPGTELYSKTMVAILAIAAFLSLTTANTPAHAQEVAVSRESGASSAYQDAYALYSAGAYEAAIQRLAVFEKSFPKSELVPQASNLHGLALLLARQPAQAILYFKKSLNASRNDTFNQFVLYNLSKAQFEANQMSDAQETLSRVKLDSLDKENKMKALFLRARILLKNGLPAESAREALAASRLLSHLQVREINEAKGSLYSLLDEALKNITDVGFLESLFREYEDSPLIDRILFRLALQELAQGNRESAETHMRALMARFPQSGFYPQAADVLRAPREVPASREETIVDAASVGVLLPLKGRFARFGQQSLQGIELAFRIFNNSEPDSKITLVIEDSGEDPEQTIKALNRLVTAHHVVAVIGPLLSKGIDKVTARAQELGVPLLSIARHAGSQGDYVFHAGLTLRMQAREVAKHAVETLGLRKFAMLFPRGKEGEEFVSFFWDSIDALGGELVGIESYSAGETDFKQAVDRLSGLYYTEARQRELDVLAKEREANNIRKLTRKTEQYYKLKPIVDYQAVFIPDDPRVAGQILPTFAYRDVDDVRFLGTSAWNHSEFPVRAEGAGPNSVFPDAFSLTDSSPAAMRYIEKYRATFGQEPTSADAIAHDAAKILEFVLTPRPRSRAEIKDRLVEVKNFQGITGKISCDDGHFTRDLKILTVRSGNIVEASTKLPK